jgi:hypothetical protein
MKPRKWSVVAMLVLLWVAFEAHPARAQGRVQAARAAAEFIIDRFGGAAAREGIEVLAGKLEAVAARFGDEAIVAARRVGPEFFRVVEGAGINGARAVRVMAEHGEPGVAWVLSRPKGMQLLLQHGEEAAAALVRHPGGIAEPAIEQFGGPAVRALQAVGPQGGRRLAMMVSEGELAKIGRTPELLGVVAQYGDRAMEFIWTHRVTLAGGAALTAFLLNPEPFINGTRDITQIVAENAIRPLAEVPGRIAVEAAGRINWDLIGLVFMLLGTGLIIAVAVCSPRGRTLLGMSPYIAHSTRLAPVQVPTSTAGPHPSPPPLPQRLDSQGQVRDLRRKTES